MKKVVLAIAATVVAWLAVSVVIATAYTAGFNPVAWLTVQIKGPYATLWEYESLYSGLNGLLILVLTVIVARPLYKEFASRWLNPKRGQDR